jgi:hypothetical protein
VIGQPAREHWSETWDVLGPLLDRVRGTGECYRGQDHPFVLDRHGYLEGVYFDISYDPIRDTDGSINGVFCFVNETTGRVLGERRLRALAELGSQLADLQSAVELGRAAANAIEYPVAPAEPVVSVDVTIEDRTVIATVRDRGQWRESTGSGFRGRGLALIRALGDLSVRRTADGTEVTLRRQLQS